MGPEAKIERDACQRIFDDLGVVNKKLTSAGERAWPDRMFVLPAGRTAYIEFKSPGEDPTPLQARNHRMLRRLGHSVEVHDSVSGAVAFIAQELRKCSPEF